MRQIDFIWKMKTLGLDVIQGNSTVVQSVLTDGVLLEHQTIGNKEMLSLVIDLGTENEIDIMIDNDSNKFQKVMDLCHSNSMKEAYINAFKK